ncbi:class III signal peptide-containing protein [Thermococcus eurythermalis]|uniref:class III signal peptide-containing protein n=1 Tax=Thermococcus eurythermalis TaxID=1505907 RepID=UPI0009DEA33C|nr:class III signal peptide-containing protein [Thermococcus eurythermalis]
MRRAQTALEYLFMLAAVLVLVSIAAKVVLDSVKNLNRDITTYIKDVRKEILENL